MRGRIVAIGPSPISIASVTDANLWTLARAPQRVELEVDPGIYYACVEVPGDSERRPVPIEGGETAVVDSFTATPTLAAPIPGTRDVTNAMTEWLERVSPLAYTPASSPGSRVTISLWSSPNAPPRSVRLVTERGEEVITVPEKAVVNRDLGLAFVGLEVPPGTYALLAESQHGPRAQPVLVERGWETQVYLRCRDWVDLATAALQIRPLGSGFGPPFADYLWVEASLQALSRGELHLPYQEILSCLSGRPKNPLLALTFSYACLRMPEVSYATTRRVAQTLLTMLPTSADLAVITLAAALRGRPRAGVDAGWRIEAPPMLAQGAELANELASRAEGVVRPSSWLGRASIGLSAGSVWTRWDAKLERADGLRIAALDIADLERTSVESAAEVADALGLPLSVVKLLLANCIQPEGSTSSGYRELLERAAKRESLTNEQTVWEREMAWPPLGCQPDADFICQYSPRWLAYLWDRDEIPSFIDTRGSKRTRKVNWSTSETVLAPLSGGELEQHAAPEPGAGGAKQWYHEGR